MGHKPTGYDLIQDEKIDAVETSVPFVKNGDSAKPKAENPAIEMEAQSVAPTDPVLGNMKTYITKTGVTPNQLIKVAYKDSDGEEVIVATKII